jgi:Curlin associated repeat
MKHLSPAGASQLLTTILATMLAAPLCLAQQDGNDAAVSQTGAGNRAYIGQLNNERDTVALVIQNGTNNIAGDPYGQTGGIAQRENGPVVAEIRQTGNANRATATQISGLYTMTIQAQAGTANVSAVRQDDANESVTRVAQQGHHNWVDGDAATTYTNGFVASQIGDNNTLTVYNRRNGYSNSDIEQNGTANQVAIEQTSSGYTFHDIHQLGQRNRVTAWSNLAWSTDYLISQSGEENLATTRTSAEDSDGTLHQTGERNVATTDQRGSSSDFAITQTGSLNTATLAQNGTIWAELNNRATIRQTGQRLNANLAQTGSANQGIIHQH